MEINKIRCFIAVAQTLNFSEAAAQLYLTQSSVSKYIKALEAEWNVTLFVRNHHEVELTALGRAILPQAQAVVAAAQNLTEHIEQKQAELAQTLDIITIPTFASYPSFSYLLNYLRENKTITPHFFEVESDEILAKLNQRPHALAFMRGLQTTKLATTKYDVITCETDCYCIAVHKDHPLAQQTNVSIEQLRQERFLVLDNTTTLLTPIIALCKQAGYLPQLFYCGQRLTTILDLVKNNMGVAVVMKKAVQALKEDDVVTLPLIAAPQSRLLFVKNAGVQAPPALAQLWHYLAHHLQ